MVFPGANLDNVMTKVSASTMAVQSLIVQLCEKGILEEKDLSKIRVRAVGYATFLKEHGSSNAQLAGARIEKDLQILFDMFA